METLTEVLDTQYQNLVKYDEMFSRKAVSLENVGQSVPYIFHLNDAEFNFLFINEKGCDWFGMSREMILRMGKEFPKKFYHPDTIKVEFPKIKLLCKSPDCQTVYTNYQQIYCPCKKKYIPCLVFVKKAENLSGMLSITEPLGQGLSISKKIQRIISEELFKRNHVKNFEYLTLRESEILRLLAEGFNNPQISDQLYISRRTVEQHRKNINRKLNVRNYRDIMSYAYAFDLI